MPTERNEELERDEEEEEEEEDAAEPDDDVGLGASPEPDPSPPPVKPANSAAAKGKRKKHASTPQAPRGDPWTHREVELMWGEMLGGQHSRSLGKTGLGPFDVSIQIFKLDAGREAVYGGSFSGSAVAGTTQTGLGAPPGDMLLNHIIDKFHGAMSHGGPGFYEVRVVRNVDNRILGRGRLQLPAMAELIAIRSAHQPTGVGATPQQQPWNPQAQGYGYGQAPALGYPPPPYGYGGPPPQPPQNSGNDAVAAELAALRQERKMLLDEVMRSAREGRPAMPPQGLGAPPAPAAAPPQQQQGDLADIVAMKVLRVLGYKGGGVAGMPGLGATPAPTPANVASSATQAVSAFKEVVEQVKQFKGLGRELGRIFDDAEVVEAAAEVPVATPVKEPGEDLPFNVIDIPETNLGGQTVKYARDKETGETSWEGILMSNPHVAEKAFEIVGGLVKTIGRAISEKANPASAGATEVVDRTPAGAFDAGSGMPSGVAGTPNGTAHGTPGEGKW
jgi:hypothetical protein